MSEEESDALIYPGPIEEGLVWASANQAVYRSRKKGRGVRSRSQTRPPTKHYSGGLFLNPAERSDRLWVRALVYAFMGFCVFMGILFFLNR